MINKNEKGFALVLSLVLLLVMSLMGGALIVVSSGDHQSNNSSDQYQQAFYVAETSLLEGERDLTSSFMGGKTLDQDGGTLIDGIKGIPPTDEDSEGKPIYADKDTPCYKSFKNITEHDDGVRVVKHIKDKKFIDIIEPILNQISLLL